MPQTFEYYNNYSSRNILFFLNLGWGYDEVLHYFKKSEDNEDPEIYKENPRYHGKGGYLTVEWFSYVDPTAKSMIKVNLLYYYKK